MKEPIKFSLIYFLVSILILMLWQTIFHSFSVEIFSYTVWLYIFYTGIGIVVFLLFGFATSKYNLSLKVRILCYAIICLFILNSIPLFNDNKFLTYTMIKGLLSQKIEYINVGIHTIAIISFVISYAIIFRKR